MLFKPVLSICISAMFRLKLSALLELTAVYLNSNIVNFCKLYNYLILICNLVKVKKIYKFFLFIYILLINFLLLIELIALIKLFLTGSTNQRSLNKYVNPKKKII
ncbi:hypothetical protein CEN46_08975 [Fischerella thermalis CCMEE 5318]|uniref:Uncharacterized protein n=1 Tax=Fischerella thermalis CCMEE 5318 TaxID=2019666 RepID=A0A2N6LIE2_9CYAN|nr:hypothetical protein CEN46_08975 [Fischerella thermalis CCMEE 5318]